MTTKTVYHTTFDLHGTT